MGHLKELTQEECVMLSALLIGCQHCVPLKGATAETIIIVTQPTKSSSYFESGLNLLAELEVS